MHIRVIKGRQRRQTKRNQKRERKPKKLEKKVERVFNSSANQVRIKYAKESGFAPSVQKFSLVAPRNFSLLDNPNEFIGFINNCYLKADSAKRVDVDMSATSNMTIDALVLLYSLKEDFSLRDKQLWGNKPRNNYWRDFFESSGFFGKAYHLVEKKNRPTKNRMYTHKKDYVDQIFTDGVIKECSRLVFGVSRRCPGIQKALIECMTNTITHANKKRGSKEYWWLAVNFNEKKNLMQFSFLDYGVGILESLELTYWQKLLGKKDEIEYQNDLELILMILEGEIRKTRTGQKNRGLGLKGIYNTFINGGFENLALVTNKVYVNFSSGEHRMLEEDFSGTFLYWEMTKQSYNLRWEN